MSEIYLVRHAQASYLTNNYDRLSDLGKQQAALLAKMLNIDQISFDEAYVGPLVRQNQTFEIIKNANHISKAAQLDQLREHEGPRALKLYYEQLIEESDYVRSLWEAFQNNPKLKRKNSLLIFEYFIQLWMTGKIKVDEIEPWDTFKANAEEALHIVRQQTNSGRRSLVVTSGGTIAAMLCSILKMTDISEVARINYLIRNASVTKLMCSKNRISLLSFNEVSHLPSEFHTFV